MLKSTLSNGMEQMEQPASSPSPLLGTEKVPNGPKGRLCRWDWGAARAD